MACEGALIVVDASQGVEAQTVANLYMALDNNLALLPMINKIDLPSADMERVLKKKLTRSWDSIRSRRFPFPPKTGVGIEDVLAGIVEKLPPPKGTRTRR